jgi:hypothetical protein
MTSKRLANAARKQQHPRELSTFRQTVHLTNDFSDSPRSFFVVNVDAPAVPRAVRAMPVCVLSLRFAASEKPSNYWTAGQRKTYNQPRVKSVKLVVLTRLVSDLFGSSN